MTVRSREINWHCLGFCCVLVSFGKVGSSAIVVKWSTNTDARGRGSPGGETLQPAACPDLPPESLVSILRNLWQACGTSAQSLHKLVSKPGSSHLRDFQHCSPSDWSRQFSPKRTDSISRGNYPLTETVNKDQFLIWSFQRWGIKSWSPPGPNCYCGQGCLLRSSESGSCSTLSIYFLNGVWCLPEFVYTLCGV